jgi:hypothetical protein
MIKKRRAGTGKTSQVRTIERLISRPDDYVGTRVADFLNSAQGEGKARILKLLGLLRDLEIVPPTDLQEGEAVGEASISMLVPHPTIEEIGVLLSHYRTTPSIQVSSANKILFTKLATNDEADAADALTQLFQAKRLHLFRTCTSCREWFYGRKENQAFCGNRKCWSDHRLETPKGKAIHKAEAKMFYWKTQKNLSKKKMENLAAAEASAKSDLRREQIKIKLSDAAARHEKAKERMAKAHKEYEKAKELTTGD